MTVSVDFAKRLERGIEQQHQVIGASSACLFGGTVTDFRIDKK